MSEVLWYYEDAGKQAGPISHAAIAEAIRSGRLPAGSRVWRAGMAGWQPWEAVAELLAYAPPPPQAAPPPVGPPPGYGAPPAPPQGWGPPPGAPPHGWGQAQGQGGQPGWGNPAGVPAPAGLYPKAPVGARFGAYVIDSLIAAVPMLIGFVALWPVIEGTTSTGALVGGGLLFAAGLAWGLVYSFTKDGRPNGQSIGKKATGLMVVHLPTNQPCSRGQSALRALVMMGLGLIPYVGGLVEPIVALSADGGRRLGDKAAGTQVIAVGDYRPSR